MLNEQLFYKNWESISDEIGVPSNKVVNLNIYNLGGNKKTKNV